MKNRVIYYQDELNDDFANTEKIKGVPTPDNFNYINHSIFYRIVEFVVYNIIVRPCVFIYIKVKFLQRFENKKALKKCKRQGYFVYINHQCLCLYFLAIAVNLVMLLKSLLL